MPICSELKLLAQACLIFTFDALFSEIISNAWENLKFLCCNIQHILSAMQFQDFFIIIFFKQTGIYFQDSSIKYDYSLLYIILISYFTFIYTVEYLYSGTAFSKKDESVI